MKGMKQVWWEIEMPTFLPHAFPKGEVASSASLTISLETCTSQHSSLSSWPSDETFLALYSALYLLVPILLATLSLLLCCFLSVLLIDDNSSLKLRCRFLVLFISHCVLSLPEWDKDGRDCECRVSLFWTSSRFVWIGKRLPADDIWFLVAWRKAGWSRGGKGGGVSLNPKYELSPADSAVGTFGGVDIPNVWGDGRRPSLSRS